MAEELAQALERWGTVGGRVTRGLEGFGESLGACGKACDGPGAAVFFNFPSRLADIPERLRASDSPVALLQFFVDHPLALDTRVMDALSELPHFRLVLPCVDSAHLLRLRWPNLQYTHVLHAVPESALASEISIRARWDRVGRGGGRGGGSGGDEPGCDVVVAGSIHSDEEISRARSEVPRSLQPAREQIVRMMLESPAMAFEQAADLVLSFAGQASGDWGLLSSLWRSVMPEVNRERRVAMVSQLQGLDVVVYGADAWKPLCTGTIRHGGNVAYDRLSSVLARGRTCLAWGPTQFAHSVSERVLLSMAAGCATVSDDRWLARRLFKVEGEGTVLSVFDPTRAGSAREAIERLLASPEASMAMARRGRLEVAERHLWRHRLGLLNAIAADASSSAGALV